MSAMDVVNLILQPVVQSLLVPIKKHIVFMTSCKKYVRDMGTGMTELNDTRNDVEKRRDDNNCSYLSVPAHVPVWLGEVENVNAEVNSIIYSNVDSCFSFKTRHEVGKKASELIEVIKRLKEEHSRIVWDNLPIPLGKVDSMKASTSSPSVKYHSDFESREDTFMKALKALEPDHKSHMIALCGMGGVGKTTMMEKLKTVVTEKRMFSLIVEAVIGEKTDPLAIQKAVAESLHIDLTEETKLVRAAKLRGWFTNKSKGKILVILDDVWEPVDLNDIGLSPFPDQGVDFKLLLTSRSRDVCTKMGVEANSIFNVNVLAEAESQRFFWEFIKDSDEADLDPDFRKVGDDIVRRCQGLPIAIKTIAKTLKCKSKGAWEDTLTRLQHHDIHEIVNEVFELSYNNLEDVQTKSVLLLCGLYPEDFDIPTEELVRYGWGLKLFNKVYTIRDARNRLNTCIEQLLNTNLLIESNRGGCIKMHDLVLAFVLKMYSKVEHASIVNHGNISEWPTNDTPDSCKRISLACNGMEEFPRDFEYPNLSFLKLTHGDKSLRFPENFYGLMEKLQVIVYEKMQYPPLLPRSLQKLRTLCLHECSLMFDCDSIGSLLNLEVLSFANCGIRKLPSTIGNLKKLKLLDLTGCVNLHIDEGVLKNLANLEELYMRVAHGKANSFTDGNSNELAERSEKLSAIEIELFENNAHLKRMSFNKLERFKISIGRFLEKEDEKQTSFENTLMLVSNKGELLESVINVLFQKTVVLHLEVDGMNDLEELKNSSFNNLRVLKISKCAQLMYLFTRRVAATLLRLEHLEVSSCDIMQTLIHDEDGGSESIRFPSLKFLSLGGLPKLAGLCNTSSVIELPRLMELRLKGLPDFTSIFPDDNFASSSSFNNLRVLNISTCAQLRYLFTRRVAATLLRLEHLEVMSCRFLQTFVHDEDSGSESMRFPSLKFLSLGYLPNLAGLCNTGNVIELPHLMDLRLQVLPNFTSIFPDDNLASSSSMSSDNFTMQPFFNEQVAIPKLETLQIRRMNKLNKIWPSEVTRSENVCFSMLKTIKVEECERLVNLFPRNPMPLLHHLKDLYVKSCGSIKKIFKIDMGCVPETGEGSSSLVSIDVRKSENLRHVWSLKNVDDSSNHIIHGFEAVESIRIDECVNFRNIFTPITASFNLKALEKIDIDYGWVSSVESSTEQQKNNAISRGDIAFPSHLIRTFHQLREVSLHYDREAQVVFDIEEESGKLTNSQNNHHLRLLPSLEELTLDYMDRMSHVWKCNWNRFLILQQPKSLLCHNLTRISVDKCRSIKYLFSPLMFKVFLSNLKHVDIYKCEGMEEIVSNRDDEDEEMATHTNVTFPPILENLQLRDLRRLQHIGGGGGSCSSIYNQFQPEETVVLKWSLCQYSRRIELSDCRRLSCAIPSYALGHMKNLQELEIEWCGSMKDVFEIKRVNDVGSCSGGEGSSSVVSPLTTTPPQKLPNTILLPDLRNLRTLIISHCRLLRDVFPFSTLQNLTKLKDLRIEECYDIRVIVKEEDGNHATTSHDVEVVVFPCLKSMILEGLCNLESFFLGMNDFQWPVLDTLEISECPKMTMFTKGHSDSPKLKYLVSDMGENSVECGLNNFFHPTTTATLQQQEVPYPSLDASTSLPIPQRMPWFYSNLIKVHVSDREVQRYIIGHNELQHMQKIEKLTISRCSGKRGIFETFEMNNGLNQIHSVVDVREIHFWQLYDIKYLWKSKQWTILKFPNLTRLSIGRCFSLKHVFTISMVGSLLQLQELHISKCRDMQIILEDVEKEEEEEEEEDDNNKKELEGDDDERRENKDDAKEDKEGDEEDGAKEEEEGDERGVNEDDEKEEDNDEKRVNRVEFPCLRSLTLRNLRSLKGFCLGMEIIHWPSLDTLEIENCPEITTFTNGVSTTPKLKLIKTNFGLCDATEGVNSFIRTKVEEGYEFTEV